MQVKPGKKPHVIFNASTKSDPHKVILNEITTNEEDKGGDDLLLG
jgi:hypothetical protein